MAGQAKKELIEVIAKKVGCGYLSDMILPSYRRDVGAIIGKIETEEYSLSEWQEVLRYLLDDDTICVSSKEAAKEILMREYDGPNKQ